MRTLATSVAVLCLAFGLAAHGSNVRAEDAKLDGKWKLVLLPFGEDEFLVLSIETKDGKLSAEALDAQAQVLGKATIKSLERAADSVTMVVTGLAGEETFKGKLVKDGKEAGRLLGTMTFRGTTHPARLEKTEADKVARLGPSPLSQKLALASREKNAKAKVAEFENLIKEFPGPRLNRVYAALLQAAEEAGLTEQEVRAHVKTWVDEAAHYGAAWQTDCRTAAMRALQGKKAFASFSLEMAQEAEKGLAKDATLEQQAAVLSALASAAKLAGKTDLAAATEARANAIETQLDEEYHHKVPPFKPETYAGRAKPEQNRVVLMELFTGAQCPPCVAADVGFDGLLKTYKTTELVTLQYHLHIPGPDPLTNSDAEARAAYYGARSTPSTFFNGAAKAPGGGGMTNAQSKYNQYRTIIDEQLAESAGAKIELTATRMGDKIVVSALGEAAAGEKKDDAEKKESKLRLRLALTEESIRYVGGNKLRFHHHVVRGLPGGVEGKELVDGRVQIKETVDLGEIRQGLNEYLSERTFPNPLPEIGFKGLALVAFIQDDSDKRVLHATTIAIPDVK